MAKWTKLSDWFGGEVGWYNIGRFENPEKVVELIKEEAAHFDSSIKSKIYEDGKIEVYCPLYFLERICAGFILWVPYRGVKAIDSPFCREGAFVKRKVYHPTNLIVYHQK